MARIPAPADLTQKIADRATQNARQDLRGRGWKSSGALQPYADEGAVGISSTVNYLLIQNKGFSPFVMWWVKNRAQPLDAKILTPNGWKEMGNLRVGDRLIAPEGGESIVQGVYPQGVRTVYRVSLADGSSTRASGDHLWQVEIKGMRKPSYLWTTEKIKTFLETQAGKGSSRWGYPVRVPLLAPVEYAADPDRLPIAPYTLGALIGDGGITHRVYLTSVDPEIISRVESELPFGMTIKQATDITYRLVKTVGRTNPYITALRNMGLMGHTCYTKFIPDRYKKASLADRIALLQGLFDTDGCCSSAGQVIFTSTSPQLVEDVAEVVRSIGGRCSTSERPSPRFSRDGEGVTGRTQYRLTVCSPHNIFHLSRKASRFVASDAAQFRKIVKIEELGQEAVQCIRVSAASSLYVTDDFIPTHNTLPLACKQGDGPHFRNGKGVGTPGWVDIPHKGKVFRQQRWRHPGLKPKQFMEKSITQALKDSRMDIQATIMTSLRGGQ